jgi:hypothetical protein
MGLSLGFELRLPASFAHNDVVSMLHRLRKHAGQFGFRAVTRFYEGGVEAPGDQWRHVFNVITGVMAEPCDEDPKQFVGDVTTALGFFAHPGKGSEAASFGFIRRRGQEDTEDWYWQCMCKTQYASAFGDEHFLKCHMRVVDMLDYAVSLGIDLTVYDEGLYWETRDKTRLLSEVDKMNRLVARIAGRFSDAMKDPRAVQSPIFEHPDFERLEGVD